MSSPSRRKGPAIPAHISEALEGTFSEFELGVLVGLGRVVGYEEGSSLVTEGSAGDAAAVVLDGNVQVSRSGQNITTLGAGAIIGELAVLSEAPRNATLVATTPVTVITLSGSGFIKLLEECPRLEQVVHSLIDARRSDD